MVASQTVQFFASDWAHFGSLCGHLAQITSEITGIEAALLTHQKYVSDFSIPQKLSWASSRQTTRVEDRAYSLLGLLDVSMDSRYGEGDKAFLRLQQEILKQPHGVSILAWVSATIDRRTDLLATSPDDFTDNGDIRFDSSISSGTEIWTTSIGIKGTLPVIELPGGDDSCEQEMIILGCYYLNTPEKSLALLVAPGAEAPSNDSATLYSVYALLDGNDTSEDVTRLGEVEFLDFKEVRRREITILWRGATTKRAQSKRQPQQNNDEESGKRRFASAVPLHYKLPQPHLSTIPIHTPDQRSMEAFSKDIKMSVQARQHRASHDVSHASKPLGTLDLAKTVGGSSESPDTTLVEDFALLSTDVSSNDLASQEPLRKKFTSPIRFWFRVDCMAPSDRFEPRTCLDGWWLPPRPLHSNVLVPSHTTGRWFEYYAGTTTEVNVPTDMSTMHSYKTSSFYFEDDNIWIYPEDASQYKVGDGSGNQKLAKAGEEPKIVDYSDEDDDEKEETLEDWTSLSFSRLRLNRDPGELTSFARTRGLHTSLVNQSSRHDWVQQVLPSRYRAPSNTRYYLRSGSGGLVGELPILLALVACSVRPDKVHNVLTECVKRKYHPHDHPRGAGC